MLPLFTALLALFYLLKDWDAHKTSLRRLIVLFLIIGIGVGGMFSNYFTVKKYNDQHQKDQGLMAGLQTAVETANKNQEDNTKHFLDAFGKLSQKVSDLQTQVNTAQLRKEAEQLRVELAATQKALIPPKATLNFTFPRPRPDAPLLRTITLPVENNIVHVEFAIKNDTDVPALDGQITLRICNLCNFASEPPNFRRLEGQPDTQRTLKFDRILPRTQVNIHSVDVQVPQEIKQIDFGITYRCRNCVLSDPRDNIGTIFLSR